MNVASTNSIPVKPIDVCNVNVKDISFAKDRLLERSFVVQDRLTLTEKSHLLKDQLQKLSEEVASTNDETKDTGVDKLHKENVIEGRDKCKTRGDMRRGNTRKRVDEFENM